MSLFGIGFRYYRPYRSNSIKSNIRVKTAYGARKRYFYKNLSRRLHRYNYFKKGW